MLRNALDNAYKIDKVGKYKYEAYFRVKGKSRKLIFIKDEDYKEALEIALEKARFLVSPKYTKYNAKYNATWFCFYFFTSANT